MLRNARRVSSMAGGAYAASVPTVISAVGGVGSVAPEDAVSEWTSAGDVSLMIALSPLLIMAEMAVGVLLDHNRLGWELSVR